MVASSAIQDNGLKPTMYFLLNAAVASEAYDESAYKPNGQTEKYLVHSSWRESGNEYPEEAYCSAWYKLFLKDKDAASKSRAKLTWKGRFKDVPKRTSCYNFYSSGDEVFEICTDNHFWMGENFKIVFGDPKDLWDWNWLLPSLDLSQYCWHKQEIGKGVKSPCNMMLDSDMAGWGFNGPNIGESYNESDKKERYINADRANRWIREGNVSWLKKEPAFRVSPRDVFKDLEKPLSVDQQNKMLACAIPAISIPMGRTTGFENGHVEIGCINMEDLRENGEPRFFYGNRWLHCDLKDVAYFFNYKLSDRFVDLGGIKESK